MKKTMLVGMAIGGVILGGCGEQSPLQKLKNNALYADLNASFWAQEQEGESSLWNAAVSYCNEHGEKPNCAVVDELQIVSRGSTKIVPFGSSGRSLSVPDFDLNSTK